MGDNWEKACRGSGFLLTAWLDTVKPHLKKKIIPDIKLMMLFPPLIGQHNPTVGYVYQLWLCNTPPILRKGQISLAVWAVYSALFQSRKRRECSALSQHPRDSDDLTQPPTQLLSFPNPPCCLSPECMPSSPHLLCFSILTYCLVTDDAWHSGPAWAFCFRSDRRYLSRSQRKL